MNNIMYFPVLKWKQGERVALEKLAANTNLFVPIIEIIEECDPKDFFEMLSKIYNGPIILDTDICDDDSKSIMNSFINYSLCNNFNLYPLLYFDDLNENINNITQIASNIVVKLPIPEDFDGPTTNEIFELLLPYTTNNKITLLLDAGEIIDKQKANTTYFSYKQALKDISLKIDKFNKIIVSLTSFPAELNIDSGKNAEYIRYDIKIFIKLLQDFKETKIINKLHYSDYGVTKYTGSEIDFKMMKYGVLPKVKYTTYDKYIVLKGEKDRKKNQYIRSYIDIAKEIISHNYYFGKTFCYGDNKIHEKATKQNITSGNSTNWVTYSANHHLAAVLSQLSNLS